MAVAAAGERRGPGRPSTGARERLLEAGLETLLEEGYAGLTYAKVADRAGENKSLISYYFGSKQGVVGAVAELVGERITEDVLREIQGAGTVAELIEGMVAGLWAIMDSDLRLARLYFDLSAVSVVDDEVRAALRQVKQRWRDVIVAQLGEAGVSHDLPAASTFLLAGAEGLAIERLEDGDADRLEAARRIFVQAAASTLG